MGLFAILLNIMKGLHLWYWQGAWIHHCYLHCLCSLAYSSEKSQEILKNLSKAFKKHLERDSLLEEIKVFNQDFSICCKTGTVLVLKLYPRPQSNLKKIEILFRFPLIAKRCAGYKVVKTGYWLHHFLRWSHAKRQCHYHKHLWTV